MRYLALCAAVLLSAKTFAADKNLVNVQSYEKQIVCEQLLSADLAGYYVATNLATQRAALIQLRPIGVATGSYSISGVKVNVSSDLRQLEFERLPDGWLVDEKGGRRVSVMSVDRSGPKMSFRFEDAQDDASKALFGVPVEVQVLRGDTLRPDTFELEMRNGGAHGVRFTRISFEPALEASLGMTLKSLIASRLDSEDPGPIDYIFSVEMKRPMTIGEAGVILANEAVGVFERDEKADRLYYKFAVAENIYQFIEDVGRWIRNWEVDRIDVLPLTSLSESVTSRTVNRLKALSRTTPNIFPPAARPQPPVNPPIASPVPPSPPKGEKNELTAIESDLASEFPPVAAPFGGTQAAPEPSPKGSPPKPPKGETGSGE